MPNEIPPAIREFVYNRARNKGTNLAIQCERCGSLQIDGIHHIIPRVNGIHRPETLILLCWKCHKKATNGKLQYELLWDLQRYYFRQGHDKEKVKELMGGKLYSTDQGKVAGLDENLSYWWEI